MIFQKVHFFSWQKFDYKTRTNKRNNPTFKKI